MTQYPQFQLWRLYPELDEFFQSLWRNIFPDREVGKGEELGTPFSEISEGKEHSLSLYSNFFNPVTCQLPPSTDSAPAGQQRDYNLELSCFDSWVCNLKDQGMARRRLLHETAPMSYRMPTSAYVSCTSNYPVSLENASAVSMDELFYKMYSFDTSHMCI
ncbi:UNVERIFIED_CONTAM: hypothetical protein FKN15_007481 [Acipenser sinensis]